MVVNQEITQEKKIKEMFKLFFDLKESKEFKELFKYKNEILKNGIIFSGIGKNWYICEKITKTFLSMGIKAQSLDPIHALHGDLGMVTNQVIIFISRSGTTEELINLAKVLQGLKRNNIKSPITVGFFLNNKLPYKDLFDHLIVPSKKFPPEKIYEFDSKNLVPSLSINILQLLLDDFGIEIFESEPNLVEGYKYNHMGGANGKKLGSDKLLKKFDG